MSENKFTCEACDNDAVFWVYERWSEETGAATEHEYPLCDECIDAAGPQHLDDAYANYLFKVDTVEWVRRFGTRYRFGFRFTPDRFGVVVERRRFG